MVEKLMLNISSVHLYMNLPKKPGKGKDPKAREWDFDMFLPMF